MLELASKEKEISVEELTTKIYNLIDEKLKF